MNIDDIRMIQLDLLVDLGLITSDSATKVSFIDEVAKLEYLESRETESVEVII